MGGVDGQQFGPCSEHVNELYDPECVSCGEGMPLHECPNSERPCGHHCNHSWTDDICDWCGGTFEEEEEEGS